MIGIVAGMVVVGRPIEFDEDDPRAMLRHLDGWARRALATPEGWASVLERCDQWLDYSPRNQVLLASYGVVGPVAGVETWARVESAEPGRMCAVRNGEHGLPVRVPVVGAAAGPSARSRSGAESLSGARSHRWERVFALEQLARRPLPGALVPPAVPKLDDREWAEAVRVASGRLLGRTPRKVTDPLDQLAALAARVPQGAGRVRLAGELAEQAAHVVADRVGRGTGIRPAFDPGGLTGRERWRTLVDVRHGADRVLAAVAFAIGAELTRSPLPRQDLVDDGDVPPGRRNYLAAADVRALPLAVWVEAGPYTRGEWLARGVPGAVGVAAFLRVNDRSYLAAYETHRGARWRLETTGRGAHLGLVGEGEADDLEAAKRAARAALVERFPEAARSIATPTNARVVSRDTGWMALTDGSDPRTQRRVLDQRVAAMISPGPGGRWQTWLTVDGEQRQGPLVRSADDARQAADGLARGALMELASVSPLEANRMVRDLAQNPGGWNRDDLVRVVGHRLHDTDRAELAATNDPGRLVELMRDSGVLAPSTMLHVLRAEHAPLDTVVSLVPTLGMPVPDAIRQLHADWNADRVDVGRRLGATTEELRAAGCRPAEMLAVAPRETLRRLDTREHTWMQVGPSLIEAGYTAAQAVTHLAQHAPTPDAFAAAVSAIVDRPVDGFALAARYAQPDDLAALSERFELSPVEAAVVMSEAAVPVDVAAFVVALRCGDDLDAAVELAAEHFGQSTITIRAILDGDHVAPVIPLRASNVVSITEAASLRAALATPDPNATIGTDLASLRAGLANPETQPSGEIDLERP